MESLLPCCVPHMEADHPVVMLWPQSDSKFSMARWHGRGMFLLESPVRESLKNTRFANRYITEDNNLVTPSILPTVPGRARRTSPANDFYSAVGCCRFPVMPWFWCVTPHNFQGSLWTIQAHSIRMSTPFHHTEPKVKLKPCQTESVRQRRSRKRWSVFKFHCICCRWCQTLKM